MLSDKQFMQGNLINLKDIKERSIDNIDISILKEISEIYGQQEISMYGVVKRVFTNNFDGIKKNSMNILRRLIKLKSMDLVNIEKEGKSYRCSINPKKCYLLEGEVIIINSKKIPISKGKFLITNFNKHSNIYQL